MAYKDFSGAMTALVTPFAKGGQFDEAAMRRLVEFQITEGINGLVVCGSTGEAATLNDDEYSHVVRTVVEAAGGKVPVVAGAGSNNTARAAELSRLAEQAGVDGLLHVSPFYNKPTVNGLLAHYGAIADASSLPIVTYNVPGRTGSNMTAETTLRLAKEIENVVAVKEASGNIEQVMDIIAGAPEGFQVLSGDDALTLPMMACGARGLISVASNEIPGPMTQLVQAALGGDWQSAQTLHYEWLDLMKANFIETNPQPVKTALGIMGIVEAEFRLPLVAMEANNRAELQAIVERHGLSHDR